MYLTYPEYVSYGGEIEAAAFILQEFKARKRIDRMTFGRVERMAEVPEAVKLCMVTLINMEKATGIERQAVAPVATSFSNDGYSESFGNLSKSTAEIEATLNQAVEDGLYGEVDDYGVPLLYRGLDLEYIYAEEA